LNVKLNRVKEKIKTSAMEIYKKVEYIHKDKAQKIYKDIAESSLLYFFKEMPLDKLKKLISFKETDPDKEEEWKTQRSEMLCISETQTAALLSFRNRP
jgi:hypothetical protein